LVAVMYKNCCLVKLPVLFSEMLESWHKGSSRPYDRSSLLGKERRPELWVFLSALTPSVGCQEGHPACKKAMPVISKGSVSEEFDFKPYHFTVLFIHSYIPSINEIKFKWCMQIRHFMVVTRQVVLLKLLWYIKQFRL